MPLPNFIIILRQSCNAFLSPIFSYVLAASASIVARCPGVEIWLGKCLHAMSRAVACSLSPTSPSTQSSPSAREGEIHRDQSYHTKCFFMKPTSGFIRNKTCRFVRTLARIMSGTKETFWTFYAPHWLEYSTVEYLQQPVHLQPYRFNTYCKCKTTLFHKPFIQHLLSNNL